jgi:gluconate 2-dehydrogenase gamma chain
MPIRRHTVSDQKPLSRKSFVIIGAGAAAAAAAPATPTDAAPIEIAATPPAHHAAPAKPMKMPASSALGSRPEAYAYLTDPEVKFIEAAVERLIPTDAHGPGGKEAGCAYYIDQQLFGRYGRGDTMYTHGPWAPALPTQGYQFKYTPAQVYRLGIGATNDYTQKTYGKTFDALDAQHQIAVLSGLEKGTITFDVPPSKVFFGMLLGDTVQGFFADPMYGGNRDKVGWKMVGFPGVGAVYLGLVEQHNKPYRVEPMGIADEMDKSMAFFDAAPVEHVQTRVAGRTAAAKREA